MDLDFVTGGLCLLVEVYFPHEDHNNHDPQDKVASSVVIARYYLYFARPEKGFCSLAGASLL
jgi:hypothetical protein